MTEQNERHHENDLTLIHSEEFQQNEKHHKSSSTLIHSQESQSTYENNLMLICFEKSHFQSKKHHENLTS